MPVTRANHEQAEKKKGCLLESKWKMKYDFLREQAETNPTSNPPPHMHASVKKHL